ncbi:SusF/SusE family outer membrane protein [Thalassotalea nanhaiensis]|uniref:SusF/SusE family outer membrane protein n=1 Tax=Thalassotalea nanhaiensis TaxID=3065648 RepID=A0ABY9TG62_9GAMM|nr:SusF/SusE family outer membrane protein [Colwelliaceae bacterium SQ345]
MRTILGKYTWILLSSILLIACGEGGDDVSFNYDEDKVISENQSNEYVEEARAPDGFKVIYYVDAGDGTPSKLEVRETFGTRSSVEDQAYGPDLVTGYSWGYTSETAQYYADADNYGSIRGDERDTAGKGVEYAFELDSGSYTVVFGFNDPWDAEGTRHVDIIAEGNALEEGYFIAVDNDYRRFDNVEVTDGVLEVAVQRTATNSDGDADPQISWIEIWGETDEETATPVQKIWISGEFQINHWELSQAPIMTAQAEGWYETTVHFQQAGIFNFIDQNFTWDSEYYGVDGEGNVVYSTDGGSMSVDAAGYYTIRFNIDTLEYSATGTDLSALSAQDNMYIWGKGFPQYPDHDWWDESTSYYDIADAIPLEKNFNGMGEHVFGIADLEFSDAVELQFVNSTDDSIAMQWGFSSLDALNNNSGEFYWHKTVQEDWQYLSYNEAAGLYTVIFDYAAGRATLIKQTTGIYMVGAGTYGDWDVSQAVAMTASEEWPGWYYVEIQFSNEDSGDEVKPYGDYKFVSDRSWDKDDYGLVDASTSDSGLVSEGESLDEMVNGGGDAIPAPPPGYYEVWFAPESLSYVLYGIDSSSTNVRTEMYIVGKGFVDYPELDWSPDNAIPMTSNFQDRGEYVFGYECLQLSDAVDIKFLGQQAWAETETDLDVGFVIGGEQTAPIIWTQADVGDGSADLKLVDQAGFYNVSFDYLANRINVVPNNACGGTVQQYYYVGHGVPGDWDVSQAEPMLIDPNWPTWYYIDLRYSADDSDYKFVSEQSWNGENWGLIPGSDSTTSLENSANSNAIPVAGEGYFNIWFEPSTGTLDIYDLTTDTTYAEMYIIGKGFVDYPEHDWDPTTAIAMVANFQSGGDYVFGLECLELGAAVDLKFISEKSWDGLDAGFVNGGEQTAPITFAQIKTGDGSSDLKLVDQAGFYDVSFDYLLNRASVTLNESGTCD